MELCLMFERFDELSRLCETRKRHNPLNYLVIINADKIKVYFAVEKYKSFISCSLYDLLIHSQHTHSGIT